MLVLTTTFTTLLRPDEALDKRKKQKRGLEENSPFISGLFNSISAVRREDEA